MNRVFQVNLDRPSRAVRRAMADSDDDAVSDSTEGTDSDIDSDEEKALYQEKLEDELDMDYDRRQKKSAQRVLQNEVCAPPW